MKVSIIIPCAPWHLEVAQRAIDSAKDQTIECDIHLVIDRDKRGPAWARNTGAIETGGDFLIFLDADDWIEPDFVEQCLLHYQQGYYVYTDLMMGNHYHATPDRGAWLAGETNTFHSPCCLVPHAAWRAVGGWDESLPALEDGAFFWSLMAHGFCGIRVPSALVHYNEGQRSKSLSEDELNRLQRKLYKRWEAKAMGCCGAPGTSTMEIKGNRGEGDVLLEFIGEPGWTKMYYPFRDQMLFIPKMWEGQQVWGDPALATLLQVAGRPLFRVLADPKGSTPDVGSVLALARTARQRDT